jgi:hypothetical protein
MRSANSFGQALGSSLVGQLQSTPGETRASAVATTTAIAPLGGDAGQPFAALPEVPSFADASVAPAPAADSLSDVSGTPVGPESGITTYAIGDPNAPSVPNLEVTTTTDFSGPGAVAVPVPIEEAQAIAALQVQPTGTVTQPALLGPEIAADSNEAVKLNGVDYLGAGLGGYSALTDIALEKNNVEVAAKLGVKYGLPGLLNDFPAAVGGAIGLYGTINAYDEGNYKEAVQSGVGGLGGIAGAEALGAVGALAPFPVDLITAPAGAITGALLGTYYPEKLAGFLYDKGFDGILGLPKTPSGK